MNNSEVANFNRGVTVPNNKGVANNNLGIRLSGDLKNAISIAVNITNDKLDELFKYGPSSVYTVLRNRYPSSNRAYSTELVDYIYSFVQNNINLNERNMELVKRKIRKMTDRYLKNNYPRFNDPQAVTSLASYGGRKTRKQRKQRKTRKQRKQRKSRKQRRTQRKH